MTLACAREHVQVTASPDKWHSKMQAACSLLHQRCLLDRQRWEMYRRCTCKPCCFNKSRKHRGKVSSAWHVRQCPLELLLQLAKSRVCNQQEVQQKRFLRRVHTACQDSKVQAAKS